LSRSTFSEIERRRTVLSSEQGTDFSDLSMLAHLLDAVSLLETYALDELSCQGHCQEGGTALVLTIQSAQELRENILCLEQQLTEKVGERVHL